MTFLTEEQKKPFQDSSSATFEASSLPFHLTLLSHNPSHNEQIKQLADRCSTKGRGDLAQDWIARGKLDEVHYYRRAAKALGVPFLQQIDLANLTPLPDIAALDRLHDVDWMMIRPFAQQKGVPFRPDSQLLCSPDGAGLDRLALKLAQEPNLRQRMCLTTPRILKAAQRAAAGQQALDKSVYRLKHCLPHLSAHSQLNSAGAWIVATVLCLAVTFALLVPAIAVAFNLLSLMVFLSIAALRVMAYRSAGRLEVSHQALFQRLFTSPKPDPFWPSYTVLVPLYKEAAVLPDLVKALSLLDYPADRLDIQLLIEVDDHETWQAIAQLRLPTTMSVVSIPVHGPRTKPKALNYALSFVKSDHVVIYDAEDRPHPSQLKEAALRMAEGGPKLACLQGRLAIDNAASNFLTRQFAIEYAALFDGLLPFIAAERLPVPLGGTSNHFRTSILKEAGGWDPYNVTEDADLGLRLTRLGYRIEILQSDTWEEAPESYSVWLKQRTRWFKGWMQTWLVHMRQPRQLWRDLGRSRFLAFQIMIAGMLVSALIHPLYIITFAVTFLTILLSASDISAFFWLLMTANSFNLMVGYGGVMLLGYRKARQRYGYGLKDILMMPLYWLMMTPAAWRALLQLLHSPHHWEKTTHGVSTTRPSLDEVPSLESSSPQS